jgi:hypothetical protein
MSLADLSSKLYTIKSRKNLPLSAAFVSMVREDLAMRYSVFNIVKSLTGSELIAQVAQSKYGKLTPQQQKEESENRKKTTIERRFKKFTVDSLVTLNNKLNTLTSITERNTVLIENLYNDLGSFRTQRKFTKKDMNVSFVRAPLRSRTVKFQIDQLRAEMNALQLMTVGTRGRNNIKKKTKNSVVGGAAAGGAATGAAGTDDDTTTDDKGDGSSMLDNALNAVQGLLFANQLRDWWKNRRPSPTATPEPTKPSPTTKPQPSTNKPQPKPTPTTATKPPTPATNSKLKELIRKMGGVRNFVRGSVIGAAAYELGPGMLDRITGAFQKREAETKEAGDKIAQLYGMKLIKGEGGTTIGYEINGKKYNYEQLPFEYKNIVDAYLSGDQRSFSARTALAEINKNQETYKLLQTVEGRSQVLALPAVEGDSIATAIIAAAKAADLTVAEPQIPTTTAVDVAAPQINEPAKSSFFKRGSQKDEGVSPALTPIVSAAPIASSDLPIDFAAFAKRISDLESGGKYDVVNSLGYLGKYQFGAMALQDMGLVKKGTTQKGLDNPNNWNIPGGKQAFLNDAKLQEDSFAKLTKQNFKTLKRINVLTVESAPDQIAGYLAVSHLLGPGGARDLSNGKVGEDAYGTKSTKYFVAGSQTQRMVASVGRPEIQPMLTAIPGAVVATPPVAAAAVSSQPASTSSAEVTATAAIVTNQKVQQVVAGLNNKINDMDKKINADGTFPSVRNSASPS